jgi:hypothetical protein
MVIDAGSLAARRLLTLIIFIISHRPRSIFGVASVNRRVAAAGCRHFNVYVAACEETDEAACVLPNCQLFHQTDDS